MTFVDVGDDQSTGWWRRQWGWRWSIAKELDALVLAATTAAAGRSAETGAVDPVHREDALNLLHYVALRQHDVRDLQRRLADHGLSSLGRSEPHVLATVLAVRRAVGPGGVRPSHIGFAAGRRALDVNTDGLFGPRPADRVPRIMVTLPSEAACDAAMVAGFAQRGMDVARINCAHDDPDTWEAMSRNVVAAASATGRHIPICFDLPGPKLRTGPIAAGPQVLRLRPVRDLRGVAILPARTTLSAGARDGGSSAVPVDPEWLAGCTPGDAIRLHDSRGSSRTLTIVDAGGGQATAEAWDTTYLETGTVLFNGDQTTVVGQLPPVEQALLLRVGDHLRICDTVSPVEPWQPGMSGIATIGCSMSAVFGSVRPGQRVMFDDGKFAGEIETVTGAEFVVRLTAAPGGGGRLRAGKGINLPDSDLPVMIIGDDDRPLIELAAKHGDMLGLSFLRHERDIDVVIEELDRVGGDEMGLILKIETTRAFERLPEILLGAMRRRKVGVMIARGDMAVESSFERLAEIQEEILWVCEAAHVPVVWATQVLDQMARTGQPSRAEITDAAMAQRAECVMLNKGPYIDVAIEALDDILRRMARHQRKKTALMRPLHAWDSFSS